MTEQEIIKKFVDAGLIDVSYNPDDDCHIDINAIVAARSAGNGSARQDKSLIVSMRRTKTWYTK